MDPDLIINDNDEPYIMYRKSLEINYRLKNGIPLKTTEDNKNENKYNKILKFVNKLLKQKNKELTCLSEFKNINEDFFSDKEELNRIIKKYGEPLFKEFNIEFKDKEDVFLLLRKLLKVISYNINGKKYINKYYYTIRNNDKFINQPNEKILEEFN